jgi:hypothetical protein
LDAWGARLTRARDIGLVGFGGIYALGYFARALHAWEYNLGVLPGVEFQYFVGGIFLFLPPVILSCAFYVAWRVIKKIPVWETTGRVRRWWVDSILAVVFCGGIALVALAPSDASSRWIGFQRDEAIGIGGLIIVVSPMVFFLIDAVRESTKTSKVAHDFSMRGRLRRAGDTLINWLTYGYFWALAAFLVVVTAVIGIRVVPVLPQELGGGAPRCAKFDVDPAQLSAPLAGVLFDPASADAKSPRTTRAVDVFYIGGDVVLFKLREAPDRRATYEIKRGSLAAIMWCVEAKN